MTTQTYLTEDDYLNAVAYLDKQSKRDRKHLERYGSEPYRTPAASKLLITTKIRINNYQKLTTMQAIDLLQYMAGQTTYQTTRGTTGDADGKITISPDVINEFGSARAIPVGQMANKTAQADMYDYICDNLAEVDLDDLYVAEVDNTFLLLWTD
jgi:hypothetical protein